MARLVREGVHLEACPSCNVQIGVVASMAEHPIDALEAAFVTEPERARLTERLIRSWA